ncbi:MAG: aminotransferase class I/II-fold pyridoxal phosphate-dependent enzyme, partial [Nocardioidaceae bacterium]
VAPTPTTGTVRTAPLADGPRYDLRAGWPDLSNFPRTAWLRATRATLRSAPREALGYGDPRGRVELRTAVADYLARARGVHVDPDRVVACSGFTQGLSLVCQVLHARGATTLATEAYGHASHRKVAAHSGLDLRALPVDDDGTAWSRRSSDMRRTLGSPVSPPGCTRCWSSLAG